MLATAVSTMGNIDTIHKSYNYHICYNIEAKHAFRIVVTSRLIGTYISGHYIPPRCIFSIHIKMCPDISHRAEIKFCPICNLGLLNCVTERCVNCKECSCAYIWGSHHRDSIYTRKRFMKTRANSQIDTIP